MVRGDPLGLPPAAAPVGGCTFRRAGCHDRFSGGHKPPWKVAPVSAGVLQPRVASARWGTEELTSRRASPKARAPALLASFDW